MEKINYYKREVLMGKSHDDGHDHCQFWGVGSSMLIP